MTPKIRYIAYLGVIGALALALILTKSQIKDLAVAEYKQGNYEAASSKLRLLAFLRDPLACDLLGRMYALGEGVEVNADTAQLWFHRSETFPNLQNETAGSDAFYVSLEYRKRNTEHDQALAETWLTIAAREGNEQALQMLSRDQIGPH